MLCKNANTPADELITVHATTIFSARDLCHELDDKLLYKSDVVEIHWIAWNLTINKLKAVAYDQTLWMYPSVLWVHAKSWFQLVLIFPPGSMDLLRCYAMWNEITTASQREYCVCKATFSLTRARLFSQRNKQTWTRWLTSVQGILWVNSTNSRQKVWRRISIFLKAKRNHHAQRNIESYNAWLRCEPTFFGVQLTEIKCFLFFNLTFVTVMQRFELSSRAADST